MSAELEDIVTPRLALRLMDREIIEACLGDDLARAGALLGVTIPAELSEEPSSLEYGLRQLKEDPLYLPWSARAMVLAGEQKMIGVIRFHSRPDPDYLRPHAPNA